MKAPWRKLTEFQTACIALVAVVVVVVTVAWWALAPRRRSRMEQPVQFPPNAGPGEMRVELRDLIPFKAILGPTPRFVGEIHNTGSVPVERPRVDLTLLYNYKKASGEGAVRVGETSDCRAFAHVLYPGEHAPCAIRFERSNHETWDSYRVTFSPLHAPPEGFERPKLEIFDLKVIPAIRDASSRVEGKIRNLTGRALKGVYLAVSVYGRDGKIVGADSTVATNTRSTKGKGRLELNVEEVGEIIKEIDDVAAAPVSCAVIVSHVDFGP